MRIDEDSAAEIGVALNEATLLGAEYVPSHNVVATTFSVLTLPDDKSPESSNPQRQIILTDVGRIAAALRDSRWNDLSASAIPFEMSELLSVVQSFGGRPIYGWEFINNRDQAFEHWKDKLSLDFVPSHGAVDNCLMLFQEGATTNRHLDLWIWFSEMLIRDPAGKIIPLSDFTAGGKRWWDALHAGDPRTNGHGIVPGQPTA
jgi:hypothetical protein